MEASNAMSEDGNTPPVDVVPSLESNINKDDNNNKKKRKRGTTVGRKSKPTSRKRSSDGTSSSRDGATTTSNSRTREKTNHNTNNNNNNNSSSRSSTTPPSSPPPLSSILIIDNGGHTVKYGWASASGSSSSAEENETNDALPNYMPNVTAKLKHQWTVLVGDELDSHNKRAITFNWNQLESVTRSTERGIITNYANQIQVWKRLLDRVGVVVPTTTDAAQIFGWKVKARSSTTTTTTTTTTITTDSNNNNGGVRQGRHPQSCAVLLLLPPFCPRLVLEQICNIWFHEFHFGYVGFATSSIVAATPPPTDATTMTSTSSDATTVRRPQQQPSSSSSASSSGTGAITSYNYSCTVDMGWSAIHIVPTMMHSCRNEREKVSPTTTTTMPRSVTTAAIRRIPLGGRHLVQLWKYYVSYRQWNLMDQDMLVQSVQEQLGYVSLNFDSDLTVARRLPVGKRPYDREYVLPDYSTTYEGYVRLPPTIARQNNERRRQVITQQQQQQEETAARADNEEHDETMDNDEESVEDNGGNVKDDGDGDNDNNHAEHDEQNEDDEIDEDDDDDDEEESDEAKRRRILRQRKEEERRRQQEEADRQVLMVSVERFTIPEVLFRPTDAGLDPNLAGLPEAIVSSISACPREYHAIMYQSIRLVGGLAQLPNLKERLERELRCLAPCQYEVRVEVMDCPAEQAWMGAKKWVQQTPYSEWSIRMDEWEASRKDSRKPKAWHRLLADNGGTVV